jgi:hypothetical protein
MRRLHGYEVSTGSDSDRVSSSLSQAGARKDPVAIAPGTDLITATYAKIPGRDTKDLI